MMKATTQSARVWKQPGFQRRQLLIAAGVYVVCAICSQVASAQSDWPHWMGPNRDNVWNDSGIVDKFPEGGPKVVWTAKVGIGYSGPAVAEGKVVLSDFQSKENVKISNFERRKFDGVERVFCLDEKSGEMIWEQAYPVTYTVSYPSGPRCTPVIENGKVFNLGAEGHLYCFNLADGKIVWKKALKEEYKTKSALWGYSAHPLIDGENLITLAGGEGSHLVALNKNTGEEVWRALTAPEQGYAPPTIIEVGGTRQLITFAPTKIAAVDPQNGKVIWEQPYEATSGSVIMTPQLVGGKYLYAAGYSNKSMLLEFSDDGTSVGVVWDTKGPNAISPVNVQPFLDKKKSIFYGMDQSGDLRAIQLPEGKRLWATSEPVSKRRVGSGTAFIVRLGESDRFILFNESGELILAKITPEGYSEIDRAKVVEPTNNAFNRPVVWSMPAYANKRAYVRNDEKLVCLDLAK